MTSIQAALRTAAARLAPLPQASPRLEAELLLAEALGQTRDRLYAWGDLDLDPDQLARFNAWIDARLAGQPIAYLLGRRAFWTLDLAVTPAVLIPRPETELLVELALGCGAPDTALQAADLGTGSGAMAAALASERPGWMVHAVEVSAPALAVARANLDRLGLERVQTYLGSWFDALPKGTGLDLVVANPPYLADTDPHLAQGDLPWEPNGALAAGPSGLEALGQIISQAPDWLVAGGWLWLEHGWEQGAAVRNLLTGRGFAEVQTHRDLAGLERASGGRWLG